MKVYRSDTDTERACQINTAARGPRDPPIRPANDLAFAGAVLRWGRGARARCPQIHSLPPHIQNIADRSDVISEAPKCSKIQIFRGSV